jgi:hypothetical protein
MEGVAGAPMEESVRKLVKKYPFILDREKVELTLRGFGPHRRHGLYAALGPLGYEIQNRLNRKSRFDGD